MALCVIIWELEFPATDCLQLATGYGNIFLPSWDALENGTLKKALAEARKVPATGCDLRHL